MSERVGKCKSVRGRTYAKKKAELIQSNNFPDGSPPKTSPGKPCSLALPKFDLSKTIVMLVEGLAEKTTETNMQIDRADKRSEGFVDQVFEPTAVPQWLCAYNYSAMTLRLMKLQSLQQCLSLQQGQKPYWGRALKRYGEEGEERKKGAG